MIDQASIIALLTASNIVTFAAFTWAFRRYDQQDRAMPLIINNLDDEARRLIAEAISADGPITATELQRRGTDPELEGRAIEIITRMGWPRPGDPAGLRLCVPVPETTLESVRDFVVGGSPQALAQVRSTLNQLLAEQRRIVSFITRADDLPAAKP